jgi:hypothetical protein
MAKGSEKQDASVYPDRRRCDGNSDRVIGGPTLRCYLEHARIDCWQTPALADRLGRASLSCHGIKPPPLIQA